jgi:HlyD family secretion protein
MERDLRALRIDPAKKQNPGDRRGGSSKWILALVFLLLGAGTFALISRFYLAPADEQPSQAAMQPVSGPSTDDADLAILKASGYIVAHHKIQLGSKVMGKVAWIGVEKGDKVHKGQLLVRLDDREYVAQVKQAEAALRGAEATLAELRAGYRTEEVQRAAAELARYRVDAANAEIELKRLESLIQSGAIAQQQVDNARSRFDMATAAARVAEQSYELMKLGPRSEQIDQASAEVDRARANVEYASTLLDATRITAPISGTVLERIVEAGEMVTTSFAGETGAKSAVVSLADLDDLQVELDISQSDFKRISKDQECTMTPEAYPDRKYRCQIAEVAPEANRQKATIQVKVQVLEPDEFLRPEMTANVTFSGKRTADDSQRTNNSRQVNE